MKDAHPAADQAGRVVLFGAWTCAPGDRIFAVTIGRPLFPAPESIVGSLLPWFRRHARDLPWRRTRDPYGIWVSEIMLQQTQVRTVIPYWERWMASLPGIAQLAAAREETVLKLWEGLGYYSRARNLQAAARLLCREHAGRLPRSVPDLLQLPGIGRYTAGAIASIAFNEPAPILDGNVMRVLTRLHAWTGDPKTNPLNSRLWESAAALVAAAAPADDRRRVTRRGPGSCSALNQSLMELGATVCTPRDPRCTECPVSGICRARRNGRVHAFPTASRRTPPVRLRRVVVVIETAERFLLHQRPSGSINGGFWEFTNRELTDGESAPRAASRWLKVAPGDLQAMKPVNHSITRHRIRLDVFRIRMGRARLPEVPDGKWVSHGEIHSLPLTAAHRRIARQISPAVPPSPP